MAKFVNSVDAKYDGQTLTATVETADGQQVILEFDGLAWAHLVGKATIENQVFQQTQLGKPASWLWVTGIQTGHVANPATGEHSFGLTLLVPNSGIMNFLLPPKVETALRDKLKPPAKPN